MELENMNEIRNDEALAEFENFDVDNIETEEDDGIGTLAAMAIGAGITAATFAVVGLVKKGIKKLKSKKATAEVECDCDEDECDCEVVDEADVEVK